MAVKFSGCMRSHGLTNFPDPTVGSNGLPSWFGVSNQAPAYKAADQVCKKDLPEIGPHTSGAKAASNRAALKYATCMRASGVTDFPDPNGQGLIKLSATGTLDPNSPQFQKAETACKRLDNGFAQQSSVAVSSPSGGAGGGS
jgi:hypothetical protein